MSNRSYSSRSVRLGVRLLAATGVVTAPLVLSGCSDETPPTSATYPDVQACIDDGMFTPDYCRQAFRDAQDENTRAAPHYATRGDCEQAWSDQSCEAVPDGNSPAGNGFYSGAHGGGYVYQPHMTGVWIGSTGNGPARRYSYPLYAARDGGVYAPATQQTFAAFGRVRTAPVAAASEGGAPARYSPVRPSAPGFIGRGGFGEAGHGFGGGE